ncbi:MAG: alpha/beta fold hydrolase [Bacillota bacterium]
MAPARSIFRSPQGEAAYLSAYRQTMQLWPLPYEERRLETTFGTVHTILSGEPDAPPLLLLHAMHTSSAIWFPNAGELGAHFRLIAFDLLGHAGRSLPTRKIRSPGDCAGWMLQALDQLEVGRTAVLGLAVGGWMGLNLALRAPDRVSRVAACSPLGAFSPMGIGPLLRMLPVLLYPTRSVLSRYLDRVSGSGARIPEALREQLILGMEQINYSNPGMYTPGPFSDRELARITQPVLLMVGEEEVLFDRHRTLKRAAALIDDLEIEVIPRAGHFLTAEQPALANRRLLSFLDWPAADRWEGLRRKP